MKFSINRASNRAYSLVEVMVASAIMMIGVAAACSLSLTMVSQEEGNVRASRALNYFENTMALFQLGLSPAEISAIMPPEPSLVSITFTPNTTAIANVGAPERVDVSMTFSTSIHLLGADGQPAWSNTWKTDGSTTNTYGTSGTLAVVTWSNSKWTGGADGSDTYRVTQTLPVLRTSVKAAGY